MNKIFIIVSFIAIAINLYLTDNYKIKSNINKQSNMRDSAKKDKPLFIYKLILTEEYRNHSKWTEAAFKIVDEHAEFFDKLGNQGILIFAGRTILNPDDRDLFGIAVIQAETIEEAKKIMTPDPVIRNKIMECNIFPFSMKIRHFKNLEPCI